MSRSTMVFTWFLSVLAALLVGWFTGVSNATRVASAGAQFMVYLFTFVVIGLAIAGAWALMRDRRGDEHHLDHGI